MVLVLAVGCAVGVAPPPGVGATGDTGPEPFVFGRVEVEEATDFCVDWSAVTTPVPAGDFRHVMLVQIAFDEPTAIAALEADSLPQQGAVPWLFDNDAGLTSVCASDLQALGNLFDVALLVGSEERTWVLWLSTGSESVWSDVEQATIVVPTPESTIHDIVLTDPI